MKIKLTGRQVLLRRAFRECVLENWRSERKTLMFSVTNDLSEMFSMDAKSIENELAEIPSIRAYRGKFPIQAWLARHYPAVSNAMFDGKTNEQCLAIWAKSKYTPANSENGFMNRATRSERGKTVWSARVNRAHAELRKNMPDRWAKSSWGLVK